MTTGTPRLRMFAGPNGSGKSTLKNVLPSELLGVYLNADELEQSIRKHGHIAVANFGLQPEQILPSHFKDFFRQSSLLKSAGLTSTADLISVNSGVIDFSKAPVNSYVASVLADFLRRCLLQQQASFTMETVMSSVDKVELLRSAQSQGYRTYLYFVATEDPAINVSRVQNRVRMGGHSVPEEKIHSRYYRCLNLLLPAIRVSNRAFIFDNSADGSESTWIAEITDGKLIEIKTARIPDWFHRTVMPEVKT